MTLEERQTLMTETSIAIQSTVDAISIAHDSALRGSHNLCVALITRTMLAARARELATLIVELQSHKRTVSDAMRELR